MDVIDKKKLYEVFTEQMVASREYLYRAIMKARTIVDTETGRQDVESLYRDILNAEDKIWAIAHEVSKKEEPKNV